MMGSQGFPALDRFMVGVVSTRVMQHANCAMLVAR
jgi:nucleotide-binding universal stress UspA family protein